jgi:hypothetical protein
VRQGYKVMHGGRLVTLFSARNYLPDGATSNDGAMLLLTPDLNGHLRIHPKRLAHLPQPKGSGGGGGGLVEALERCGRCIAPDCYEPIR